MRENLQQQQLSSLRTLFVRFCSMAGGGWCDVPWPPPLLPIRVGGRLPAGQAGRQLRRDAACQGRSALGALVLRSRCQPGRQDSHPLAPLPWRVQPGQPRWGITHSFPFGEKESRKYPILPSISEKMFHTTCSPPELASLAHSTSWHWQVPFSVKSLLDRMLQTNCCKKKTDEVRAPP